MSTLQGVLRSNNEENTFCIRCYPLILMSKFLFSYTLYDILIKIAIDLLKIKIVYDKEVIDGKYT